MDEERIYTALRAVVGRGGSADDETGIEGLWRRCRARGLALIAAQGEQSALEALPDHALDLLPYYERLLDLSLAVDATDDERRAAAAFRYTSQDTGALPELGTWLRRIDARFAILEPSDASEDVTVVGRAFDDYDLDEPYDPGGLRRSTEWANYSTRFLVDVLLDLGNGVPPTPDERAKLRLAHKVLGDGLPAPCDFQVTTAHGFILDVSLLDLTSFDA